MALKRIITEEEFNNLADHYKEEYKKVGDNYQLDLSDYEDPAELKRAKDREKEAARIAKQEAKELKEKLDEIQRQRDEDDHNNKKKTGDVEALEKSWQEKLTKSERDFAQKLENVQGQLRERLVDNEAQRIAAEISTSPRLIFPHIKARLRADFEGDSARTVVLDADGKPSALTVKELQAEFVANQDFAAIIKGSNASGSGANGSRGGGGATKKGYELSEKERVDLMKSNPAEFNRMKEAGEFNPPSK